jgi:hypothetical protein
MLGLDLLLDVTSFCDSNWTSLSLSNLQANFVYKRARGSGFFLVMEQDGEDYYHLNFLARDKNEHSQLFFGEIKARLAPKEEHVTCCCPVSPSNVGTKHYCRQTVSASASPKCSTKHHCSFSNACRIPCCKRSEGPRCAAFRGGGGSGASASTTVSTIQIRLASLHPSPRPPSSPSCVRARLWRHYRCLSHQHACWRFKTVLKFTASVWVTWYLFHQGGSPRFVNPRIGSKPLRFSTLSSQTNLTLSVDCIQR